jgi:putative membrane protein
VSSAGHRAPASDTPGTDGDEERPPAVLSDEADPRFTFANERTFLAWNRTALALIAAGLGVAQLLDFRSNVTRLVVALPLIALGGLIAATSFRRWEENEQAIHDGRPLTPSSLPQMLAWAVAGMGAVAVVAAVIEVLIR